MVVYNSLHSTVHKTSICLSTHPLLSQLQYDFIHSTSFCTLFFTSVEQTPHHPSLYLSHVLLVVLCQTLPLLPNRPKKQR